MVVAAQVKRITVRWATSWPERIERLCDSRSSVGRCTFVDLRADGRFCTAIEIFKLNVEAYPNGFNAYDSLGEGYMEAGKTELAIQNYERSLELNPGNENAKQMLERMGVEVEEEGEGAGE